MCFAPVTLKRAYRTMTTRRNDVGFTDVVPCGKCPQCLKDRQNSWAFRLYNEMQQSTSASFITLTYDETPKTENGLQTLDKVHLQKFIKRLRKGVDPHYTSIERKRGIRPLKYYACGEYGTITQRSHYHAVVFNLPIIYTQDSNFIQSNWRPQKELDRKNYLQGHVHIAECNMATIYYTTKYMQKGRWEPISEEDDREPEFSIMSKKMGLNYLTDEVRTHFLEQEKNFITMPDGWKQKLPRYFKEKIYNKEQRKIITENSYDYYEQQPEKFTNENHKIQWLKDAYRKSEKEAKTNRLKL